MNDTNSCSWERYLCESKVVPDGWRGVQFSTSEKHAPKGFMRIEGAVCPAKRSGLPDWKKRDVSTQATHFIDLAEFDQWKQVKADRLGICCACWGDGKVWAGWNIDRGHRYLPCSKCGGTGKPAMTETAANAR